MSDNPKRDMMEEMPYDTPETVAEKAANASIVMNMFYHYLIWRHEGEWGECMEDACVK